MIVVVFKYLTPKGFRGLTLYPFVLISNAKDRNDKVFLNHEKIHIRQQLELLVLPFYVWYILEFLFRWIQLKIEKKHITLFHLNGKLMQMKKTLTI